MFNEVLTKGNNFAPTSNYIQGFSLLTTKYLYIRIYIVITDHCHSSQFFSSSPLSSPALWTGSLASHVYLLYSFVYIHTYLYQRKKTRLVQHLYHADCANLLLLCSSNLCLFTIPTIYIHTLIYTSSSVLPKKVVACK